jgi:ankyrin repeat protein
VSSLILIRADSRLLLQIARLPISIERRISKRMNKKFAVVILAVLICTRLAFCGEIHDATKSGDLEKVKALLKANPDLVNSKDSNGETPLHIAAAKGYKDVAELLLANKADVNAKDSTDETPLHDAATDGHKEVVKLLLANRADVNAKDNDGLTPLHEAASQPQKGVLEYKDVVELLLANKADVNAKDNDGLTPLHYAKDAEEITGRKDMTELLRKHGGHE